MRMRCSTGPGVGQVDLNDLEKLETLQGRLASIKAPLRFANKETKRQLGVVRRARARSNGRGRAAAVGEGGEPPAGRVRGHVGRRGASAGLQLADQDGALRPKEGRLQGSAGPLVCTSLSFHP
jgi:hypothetical protein